MINNSVTNGLLLEFETVFPNQERPNVDSLLLGVPKNDVLLSAIQFLSINNGQSRFNDPRELIRVIFSPENIDLAEHVTNILSSLIAQGVKVSVVHTYSSLKIFERFFNVIDNEDEQSNADFERNLFKAYLVQNSEFTEKQSRAFSSVKHFDKEFKLPMMYLCTLFPVSDKMNYSIHDILLSQILKAVYLFIFLDSNDRYRALLNNFLKQFNCATWRDYLKKLLPLALQATKHNDDKHVNIVIDQNDDYEENVRFLEKLVVSHEDSMSSEDFLTLRSKPFHKVSDGVYRVIFDLFLVEKVFKGLYFLLRNVNSSLPKKEKISSWRGEYCYEFSEKFLLYKCLEQLYIESIKLTGEEMANLDIDGSIDYYVRSGKNVMLYESKDFLIAVDKKMSFDYDVIEPEFARTLYYEELANGKEKAGAVLQLIRNIKRVLKYKNTFDKDYNYKDLVIYPIIITHDHQYDVPGLSQLVNDWFSEELINLKNQGCYIERVRPCVLINIDSLLLYQKIFRTRYALHALIEEYLKMTKVYSGRLYNSPSDVQKEVVDKLLPFSLFLERKIGPMNYENLPTALDDVKDVLFNE